MRGAIAQTLHIAPDAMEMVGARIAMWCGREPAKQLARNLGANDRTVQGWREGRPPAMRHLHRMVEYWGPSFLEDVFGDVLQARPGDFAARLRRMRAELDVMEAEYAQVSARMGPGAAALAPVAGAPSPGPGQRSVGAAGAVATRAAALLMLGLACFGAGGVLLGDGDQGMLRARAPRPSVVRMVRVAGRVEG